MMEVSTENSMDAFMEIDVGKSAESFQKFLESQKVLFHRQVDQLQKIVVTQCRLTGVNPLSQEMAAGALSIKIGKRPRDLLNPKAVKYMQSVFSIKDTISKKESREISALCGVTVTQVREFFAGRRSRVRMLVRLSKEKVVRSKAFKASQDGCSAGFDSAMSIDQVPSNPVDSNTVEEVPFCSLQEEPLLDIDNFDKNFLENIFNLMRKEETFSGQVKLMEWILQIQNSSVLYWFLTNGGLMILTTWLSHATLEEQTTVLLAIFKVLCHLPLHKALPIHMSAILQTVNRLRFYRSSGMDISNRARVLLSRWSNLFVRSQVLKRPNRMRFPNAAQKETIQKQRVGEILSDEAWQSQIDIPEEILALTFEGSENSRKSDPPQKLKLLPASADDRNRRNVRSLSSQTRERRKVLLVEQPWQKTGSRSLQVARAVPANRGRPMSADDIQKAKMRALFMQSKYGKIDSSSSDGLRQKTKDPMKPSASQRSNLPSASKTHLRSKIEEDNHSAVLASTTSPSKLEDSIETKASLDHQGSLQEKFRRDQISWQIPPEMRINSLGGVGTGEKSKEVEAQIERIRREKETFYHSNQEIPPNPREPWDLEIDYDDTLTPEIRTEQPPEAVVTESLASPIDKGNTAVIFAAATSKECCPPPVATNNGCAPEPDLELLAVLLKNPQLVFALTSGQGGNLTSAETVRLLDMIKASGIGLPGILNGMGRKAEEKVEVKSLPSPTPGSNHLMSGWRCGSGKDRFSQAVSAAYSDMAMTSTIPSLGKLPLTGSVQPQIPSTNFSLLQIPTVASPVPQQLQTALQLLSSQQVTGAAVLEKQLPSISQQSPTIPPLQRAPISEAVLSMEQFPLPSSAPQRSESVGFGQMHNVKPASISIVLHPPKERPPIALHPLPALLPNPPRPQPPLLPNPPSRQPLHTTWPPNANAAASGKMSYVSATSLHFQANQNNYNAFSRGLLPPPSYGSRNNGYMGDPELEMWCPEGSPVRPPSYQSGWSFPEPRNPSYQSGWSFPEPRNGYGWNSRPDRSRQRNSGYGEQRRHGGRWRERRH